MKILLLFGCLLSLSVADDPTVVNTRRFPENFKLGVANAAPQIEGAWDTDGKGETIWDNFARTRPEMIGDRSTPAIACDSYHKYKEDVALVKQMGLDIYRLSIAWSRVLPTGKLDKVNALGIQYYKNLLKECRDNNIEPLVTLYHWDLPQPLQDEYGGWLNQTVIDLFVDYAKLMFETFGDDVKWWVTINEPKQVCGAGYGGGTFAPGIVSPADGEYLCNKNVLIAHAKAYRLYDEQFRAKQGGKVAMVIDSTWWEPGSDSEADLDAANRIRQFMVVPWGFRKLLVWLKNTYSDEEIVVTENGFSDLTGTLEDDRRVAYFRDYISNALDAIYEDKVNLTAYIAWSIIDDWEWTGGYGSYLGMYKVDFNDPERPRIKRKSADYFTQIVKNRCLVEPDQYEDDIEDENSVHDDDIFAALNAEDDSQNIDDDVENMELDETHVEGPNEN
ncbi:hypothetical protein JTB14_028076 [Gonioctena quinquepunctata]|nr:hypothetical protein JTB14_028076 [Gonioctena quinquepunctata]